MKIAIFYSYNGARFLGSQTQPHEMAVEDKLNEALRKVGITNKVISSSRTDKDVHALMQVSSVVCGDFWANNLDKLKKELNSHVGLYLKVFRIDIVDDSFQVRFDAKSRVYAYVLALCDKNPFLSDFVCFEKSNIDLNRLNLALNYFLGSHDFRAFRKTGSCEKSTIRHIYKAHAYKTNKIFNLDLCVIKFKANGFLRSQVRLMVANALFACKSDENLELFISNFLNNKASVKIPAPPQGLYLQKIIY